MCLAAMYYCSPDRVVFVTTREDYSPYYVDDRKYFTLANFYGEFAKPWDRAGDAHGPPASPDGIKVYEHGSSGTRAPDPDDGRPLRPLGGAAGISSFAGRRRFGLRPGQIAAGDLDPEPGAGIGPVAVGRGNRQAKDLGRLGQRHPGEDAELDKLGLDRVLRGKLLEGLVEGQQIVVGLGAAGCAASRSSGAVAATLEPVPPAGVSTRIRRMASAAAAKKWPRPSQGRSGVRRRPTAVRPHAPAPWPGGSDRRSLRASRCAASRRSSS